MIQYCLKKVKTLFYYSGGLFNCLGEDMRSIGYHFFESGYGLYKSSRESSERPIIINCAGNFYTEAPLSTKCVGRLDYYFIFLVDGSMILHTRDESVSLYPGDYLLIPPETPYSYEYCGGEGLHYFWVHFTGSEAPLLAERYNLKLYPEHNSVSDTSEIISSMHRFTDACAKEESFKELELSILFERLILKLARKSATSGSLPLKKSLSYINAFYNTEIKIPALARMEGLSTSRYNAVFRHSMNMSPSDYIIKTRITFACELLVTTELSIKEIGVLVGYNDAHFFSRIFKSKTGISPKEYRMGETADNSAK